MAPSRPFIFVPFLLLGRRLSPPLKRGWRASSAQVPLPLAFCVGAARGGVLGFGGRCLSSPAALRSRASASHRHLTPIAFFNRGPCSSHRPLMFIAWRQRVTRHPADFQPPGCRVTRWRLLVVTLLPTGSDAPPCALATISMCACCLRAPVNAFRLSRDARGASAHRPDACISRNPIGYLSLYGYQGSWLCLSQFRLAGNTALILPAGRAPQRC